VYAAEQQDAQRWLRSLAGSRPDIARKNRKTIARLTPLGSKPLLRQLAVDTPGKRLA
jgi:hypothetical protein